MNDLADIQEQLRQFNKERNWEQFHSPKNLSMALAAEAGEVLDLMQWLTEEQSKSLNSRQISDLSDELADVLIYLLTLADVTGINLTDAIEAKLKKNQKRFPPPLNKN